MAEPPTASVRRQVSVPLRFADGYATTTEMVNAAYLAAKAHHFTRSPVR